MSSQPTLTLNDGTAIPRLGLGVWKVAQEEAEGVVREALEAGYRHIDTAAAYGNEEGVGSALARTPLKRHEIFVTTKLWNSRQGYDSTLRAFDESMGKLGLEVLDLYLIHWPMPKRDTYIDTFKAFMQLKKDGRVRSIGVSNFTVAHLERLIEETGVVPSVNQIELHPDFQQLELRAFHDAHGIATESWSPLGRGTLLDDPTIKSIAEKHGKTPAQAIIRWHLDEGLIVFPKSSNPERIRANIDVFDFTLDDADKALIAKMDRPDTRLGADPDEADFE